MSLHTDTVRTLTAWSSTDDVQARRRQHFLDHLSAHPDAMWRTCRRAHLTASALVVSADLTRVLLTLHTKAGLWLQTGGHCETGDLRIADVALREATEETGVPDLTIDPVPVRLSRHAVEFCRPTEAPETSAAGPTEHLDVQFVAVAPAGSLPARSDESDDVRWFALDDLPRRTDHDVHQLVEAAHHRLRL